MILAPVVGVVGVEGGSVREVGGRLENVVWPPYSNPRLLLTCKLLVLTSELFLCICVNYIVCNSIVWQPNMRLNINARQLGHYAD